jgi:hypothetical protein
VDTSGSSTPPTAEELLSLIIDKIKDYKSFLIYDFSATGLATKSPPLLRDSY